MEGAVSTAAEYRQNAQECIEGARQAANDAIRKQFLDLAKLWMIAADKMDAGEVLPDDSEEFGRVDGPVPRRHSGVLSDEPN
jgi:hypothetical protein